MPEHPSITLIRPLLWNTRAELEAYCKEHGLEPCEDATNADPTFLRNHIRLDILPSLEKVNPHLQRALVQLADIARVEDDYVQERLAEIISSPTVQKQQRRIVIERARRNCSLKYGGALQRIVLEEPTAPQRDEDLIALDEALSLLEAEDALAAKVVKLRFFTGLSHEEVAAALEMTVYLARQKWTYARAWLRSALRRP